MNEKISRIVIVIPQRGMQHIKELIKAGVKIRQISICNGNNPFQLTLRLKELHPQSIFVLKEHYSSDPKRIGECVLGDVEMYAKKHNSCCGIYNYVEYEKFPIENSQYLNLAQMKELIDAMLNGLERA